MVTDRLATAGLLAVLGMLYPRSYMVFLALMFLDIFSHWFQMYSTFISGSETHKARARMHAAFRFGGVAHEEVVGIYGDILRRARFAFWIDAAQESRFMARAHARWWRSTSRAGLRSLPDSGAKRKLSPQGG